MKERRWLHVKENGSSSKSAGGKADWQDWNDKRFLITEGEKSG